MSTKKILISISAFALMGIVVGLTTTSFSSASYYSDSALRGSDCTPDRHKAMEEAFANNDYNAWLELMTGKGIVKDIVNEENFHLFADMHNLREQGDIEGANEIRAELGLGVGRGMHRGYDQGRHDHESCEDECNFEHMNIEHGYKTLNN
ncbi:hypothetical protein ISS06_00395 [Patescibacteria group bacterium]|nr:hypothetical protein [Patescibacteria group bacterium]